MPIPHHTECPDLYDGLDCRPDFKKSDAGRDAFVARLRTKMAGGKLDKDKKEVPPGS